MTEVGDPLACPNLPAAVATYKGGDSFGEELRVQIDPATMAYTVTVDASLQRTAGTTRSGTLVSQGQCSYTSGESGAVFAFAPGGVLLGGVNAPSGGGFAPLLAFQNTFENSASPAVFNPVANIFNTVGVQQGSGSAVPYAGAVRLRNAGTFQYCRSAAGNAGSFMVYDANCTETEKGYISWNGTRNAFDLRTTAPTGGATTTGGTLTGSMVIGLVNGAAVPMHLVRESATSFGLRLHATQLSLTAGAADGSYVMASVKGENAAATVTGTGFNLAGTTATLSYDKPVPGVVESSLGAPDHFLFNSGVLGFVSGAGTSAALQLGVRH